LGCGAARGDVTAPLADAGVAAIAGDAGEGRAAEGEAEAGAGAGRGAEGDDEAVEGAGERGADHDELG